MRKIFISCMTFLVLLAIIPVSSAFAANDYNGGLLDGVSISGSCGPNANATDNNEATFLSFSGNTDVPLCSVGTYTLVSVSNISSVRYKADASGLRIVAYDASNLVVGELLPNTYAFNGTSIDVNWNNVKTINMERNASGAQYVYEFNVYATAPPDTTPPAVPTGVTGMAGNAQAVLNWNAVADTDLALYKVYKDGTYLATITKPTTTYTATGLTNGTSYLFQVSSVDTVGNESVKSTAVSVIPVKPPDITPPTVPTGVTATDVGSGTGSISWNSSTDSDSGVAGYNLYQNGTKVNTSGLITVTTSSVTGLTIGQTYSYEVSAVDVAGNESANSTAAFVTITANLNVTLIPNMDSIVIQLTGGLGPYSVNWGSGSGSFNSTSYIITGLTANTIYTVSISDISGKTFSQTVNTGNMKAFTPPTMPNPVSVFQMMIDNFGTAGTIALAVIGAAIGLGILVILAMYGWRLAKKWLASSK